MLNFVYPWLLMLLPLPWLARRTLPPGERSEIVLSVPLLNAGAAAAGPMLRSSRRVSQLGLWAVWLCLLCAAARPYWLDEPVSRKVSGRDLMLALDISGSMTETDMAIGANSASRIDVLKIVVDRFIERRQGDRLGLILFGTNAYNFVPLTFDLDTLRRLLQDISTGLAGRHTAIGDAIGLAVKLMRDQATQHRVLILVTDGSNTAGFDDPLRAALAARRQGLTIYTIGIGSDAETLGRTYGAQNIPPGTVLNETLLRQIAQATGGEYYRATDSRALERIYTLLDRLEPVEYDFHSYRPRRELFRWPLAAGIVVLLSLLAQASLVLRSRESAP